MKSLSVLIPAAGLGSRLFPVTWAIPKELLPLSNKPALHYVLEEALFASIHNVICVTSPRKEALVSYLTYEHSKHDILNTIEEKKRLDDLDLLNKKITYEFIIQKRPAGIGNAMMLAHGKIKEDFFCMAYPDDIMITKEAGLPQLIKLYKRYNCSVILVEKVPSERIHLYGVITIKEKIDKKTFYIDSVLEKPTLENAPSLYAVVGRYLLSTTIFSFLEKQQKQNPCWLTGLNDFIAEGNKVIAVEVIGKRYDIGTVSGWLEAIKDFNKN